MGILAGAGEGELAHVGLGDDDGARRAQAADHDGIAHGRRRIAQNRRASPRRFARDVEQVLDADDGPVELAKGRAGTRPCIGRVGGRAGGIPVNREAGTGTFALGIGDPGEGLFEAITG